MADAVIKADNAGFELLGDLCLADYLLSTAQVRTVRFHAKLHPTFVSDAMIADVVWSKYSNLPFFWRFRALPVPALRLVFRPTLDDTHRQYGW